VPKRDVGIGMDDDEVTELSAKIDLRQFINMLMVKAFSVLYTRQRVGQDQPAVDGDGESIMVVNECRRAGG
jgi:hypothetical protein